jgi:hypothetical protein
MAKPASNRVRLLGNTCDLLVAEVSNEQIGAQDAEGAGEEVLISVGRAGSARRRSRAGRGGRAGSKRCSS